MTSLYSKTQSKVIPPGLLRALSQHSRRQDELVLEDATEESETVLGSGASNVFISDVSREQPPAIVSTKCKQTKSTFSDTFDCAIISGEQQRKCTTPFNIQTDVIPRKISVTTLPKINSSPDDAEKSSNNVVFSIKLQATQVQNSENSISEGKRFSKQRPLIRLGDLPDLSVSKADGTVSKTNGTAWSVDKSQFYEESAVSKQESLSSKLNNIMSGRKKVISTEKEPAKNNTTILPTSLDGKGVSTDGCSERLSSGLHTQNSPIPSESTSLGVYPIDINTAMDLKIVLLGSANLTFTSEWKRQYFSFNNISRLRYGLIQKKRGGPSGVLACVQGYIFKNLLISAAKNHCASKSLDPGNEDRKAALVAALANIFWRAADGQPAIVALVGKGSNYNNCGAIRFDEITEKLMLASFNNYCSLIGYIEDNIQQFLNEDSPGVILATYSTILSRTIPRVNDDMDRESSLLNEYGLCRQELINLLLTGRAVSYTCNNNVVEQDKKTLGMIIKKGIKCRSDVGFLSTLEHFRKSTYEVGTFLKTPLYPVWVTDVCGGEGQYGVLMCTRRELLSDWRAERKFDLLYHDCISVLDQQLMLNIDSTLEHKSTRHIKELEEEDDSEEEKEDRVSPVDLCIRTKWNFADISWNGADPIFY